MKTLLSTVVWLVIAVPALAQVDALSRMERTRSTFSRHTAQRPHPSIVRIVSYEKDGVSLGSGSLIAVHDERGLILTNWHVVRDGGKEVTVRFGDGKEVPGQVVATDESWDLAAIEIARPTSIDPLKLSLEAPQRGDRLSIAGYGAGDYRQATGRCTQYLSPGGGKPYEMLEVSVAARQGDSGGPILNDNGELVGVLFGTTGRTTSGAFCGRVRQFLRSIPLQAPTDNQTGEMLAARPSAPYPRATVARASRSQPAGWKAGRLATPVRLPDEEASQPLVREIVAADEQPSDDGPSTLVAVKRAAEATARPGQGFPSQASTLPSSMSRHDNDVPATPAAHAAQADSAPAVATVTTASERALNTVAPPIDSTRADPSREPQLDTDATVADLQEDVAADTVTASQEQGDEESEENDPAEQAEDRYTAYDAEPAEEETAEFASNATANESSKDVLDQEESQADGDEETSPGAVAAGSRSAAESPWKQSQATPGAVATTAPAGTSTHGVRETERLASAARQPWERDAADSLGPTASITAPTSRESSVSPAETEGTGASYGRAMPRNDDWARNASPERDGAGHKQLRGFSGEEEDLAGDSEASHEFLSWQDLAGRSFQEQVKSILATIGFIGVLLGGFKALRML